MDGMRTEKQEEVGYPPEPTRGRTARRKDKAGKTADADRPYSDYSPASASSSSSSSSDLPATTTILPWIEPFVTYLYAQFAWVPQNTAWSKLKPAIRCALVAWLSVVLFVIPSVEGVLGQASFLILIGVVLSPPSDPFLSVLEREILILVFVCIAWAWCCLALFLANLARRVRVPTATIFDVADGRYIEAAPSVIVGVFIFLGSSCLLAFKAKQGPGPFLFPSVLACLCINISLTTGILFPFPYYIIGRSIVVPLAFHSALSLLASVFIFPSTISAQFTTRIADTLTPAISMLSMHTTLLSTPLTSPDFPALLAGMRGETKKTEAALIPLAAGKRLLSSDVIYGRFGPGDFTAFQGMLRRLAGRANGLGVFFTLVDPGRERFPGTGTGVNTPAGTAPGTPRVGLSRVTTRAGSMERDVGVVEVTTPTQDGINGGGGAPLSPVTTSRRSIRSQHTPAPAPAGILSSTSTSTFIPAPVPVQVLPTIKHSHSYAPSVAHSHLHLQQLQQHNVQSAPAPAHSPVHASGSGLGLGLSHILTSHSHQSQSHSHSHSHHTHAHHHHHHALLHSSLLSLARARARKPEYAVGTFESQRYLNLEATTLWDPNEEEWNERIGGLLGDSCTPLLASCSMGLSTVKEWLSTVRDSRLKELARSWIGGRVKGHEEYDKRREERIKKIKEVRSEVEQVLDEFRRVNRHTVLEPYKQAFDHHTDNHADSPVLPQHNSAENSAGPDAPSSGSSPDESRGGVERDYVSEIAKVDSDKEKEKEKDRERERDKERDHHHHGSSSTPAHRYLFNCFVYQYNLLQIASIVLEMLDEILRLEEERPKCRLWTPAERVFSWKPWLIADTVEHLSDDDDPDIIQGINRSNNPENYDASQSPVQSQSRPQGHAYSTHSHTHPRNLDSMPSKHTGPAFQLDPDADLGLPRRRDPDALPPRNLLESLMGLIYKLFAALGTDGVLFGIKAGLLSVALSLPSLIKGSAGFAYDNRFVWGIFMGQLTIARFRGDTIFGISARIISTFFGAIMSMLIWYISCGSGKGNPYGLAVVCAVIFPFFFFARLYWPIPPMRNIVFFVTIILVIGYSYQDEHISVPGAPGVGWPVAWKRFTLVTAGVVAAFVASFFPPSTTIRLYQRRLLATTSSELGTIYCAIISFANTKHEPEIQEIVSSLLAVRNKLAKSAGLRTNVIYEFSLKGRWPADRYQKIADLQVGISYCLSHLMSVLEHLEPAWSRAFLRRTRFMDPGFQGDVLAVISMISSSLRTGNPLPQITPCPLVDRFLLKYHGLDVIHKDAEEDYGLPRSLSIDTLKDEQYLMFSVGISTAFGIINRLDRLMIAVKEIVGEQYHIHGVGFVRASLPNDHWMNTGGRANGVGGTGGGGVEMGPRTNTVHFDEPGQFQV